MSSGAVGQWGSGEGPTDVVEIESLGAGGAGVGHLPDGMIVFVQRTAPGDRVRLRDVRRHQRHATAKVAEIVTPGPGRVEPPCPHFVDDRCGGCQWQHVSESVQQASRSRIVGNALRRIGGLDVPDPGVVASPRQLGYRTTITLAVRRHAASVIAGYHELDDPDRVFMLERCLIARDEVNELWAETRRNLDQVPRGDDLRLKLRVDGEGHPHALIGGNAEGWRDFGGDAPGPSSSFVQVNAEIAELLRDAVIRGVLQEADAGTRGREDARIRVLDLYAGSGDTAVPLAQLGHDVVMVEMDARATKSAELRARAAGVRMKWIVGRVEDHLTKLLPADVVIVNPPRAGLSEQVTAALTARPPARLVYVSCDPATLARDLKRLGARPVTIQSYDMFPQTSHVETLVIAEMGAGGRGAGAREGGSVPTPDSGSPIP